MLISAVLKDGLRSYACLCAAGFSGSRCETNINECNPNPCQNGGSCTVSTTCVLVFSRPWKYISNSFLVGIYIYIICTWTLSTTEKGLPFLVLNWLFYLTGSSQWLSLYLSIWILWWSVSIWDKWMCFTTMYEWCNLPCKYTLTSIFKIYPCRMSCSAIIRCCQKSVICFYRMKLMVSTVSVHWAIMGLFVNITSMIVHLIPVCMDSAW